MNSKEMRFIQDGDMEYILLRGLSQNQKEQIKKYVCEVMFLNVSEDVAEIPQVQINEDAVSIEEEINILKTLAENAQNTKDKQIVMKLQEEAYTFAHNHCQLVRRIYTEIPVLQQLLSKKNIEKNDRKAYIAAATEKELIDILRPAV